jgi:hypothetical protein
MPGLGSAHLLQGAQAAAMTHEQRICGADRGVDSAIIVTGYDSNAVAACAQERCAVGGLPERGARECTCVRYWLGTWLANTEVDVDA